MKINKVYTSSFAIDAGAEKRILKREGGRVKVLKKYLPLCKFRVDRTEEVQKGVLFKRKSFDKRDNYFYVDLSTCDLYYTSKGGFVSLKPGLEKSDILHRVIDFDNKVIATLGQLQEYGSIAYDDLDQRVVDFLSSEGFVEIYETESNQFFNFFRYYLADDIIMHKYFVRPAFHLPHFGNSRYCVDASLEVTDSVDESYTKESFKYSNERVAELLEYLFHGKATVHEISYLPCLIVAEEKGRGTKRKISAEVFHPVCSKGSRKVKTKYEEEAKLEPISFMTRMDAFGSVPLETSSIDFSSVADLEDVKEKIRHAIIYPLTKPELARKFKKKGGGSILFYGPPGCGKTYIARATVGECGVNFFNVNVSDIMAGGAEVGAKNFHDIFQRAARNAPAIVFLDEIDALGGRREAIQDDSARVIVNQLLMELDGVESMNENVLILASTNAPWDIDPALRRAGRFTQQIFIPPPDHQTRLEIFKIHTRKRPVESNVNYEKLAELTDGYSSADIKAVCDDALDIPWGEALKGKPSRMADMNDFRRVLGKRESSLDAWYKLAQREIKKSGEVELFKDLAEFILQRAGGVEEAYHPKISFKDIADLDHVKEIIRRSIVYPMKDPGLAKKFKKRVGGGLLMYGPPGCGKTFIAKATAGECDATFFNVKITDVFSGEESGAEERVHEIFERAKHNRPAIIFLDEIDALFSKRSRQTGVDRRIVNQFLTELDGFEELTDVMVIGSTNSPWDVDPAVRRPGRLTDQVYVPVPDYVTRLEIFKIHTRNKPVTRLDFEKLAGLTDGYSSVDIKSIVDHTLEIPWEEAFYGGVERKADMEDFLSVLKNSKSSLLPWFRVAEKEIKASGEKDLYSEVLEDIGRYSCPAALSTVKKGVASERVEIESDQRECVVKKLDELMKKKRKLEKAVELVKDKVAKRDIRKKEGDELIRGYHTEMIELEVDLQDLEDEGK